MAYGSPYGNYYGGSYTNPYSSAAMMNSGGMGYPNNGVNPANGIGIPMVQPNGMNNGGMVANNNYNNPPQQFNNGVVQNQPTQTVMQSNPTPIQQQQTMVMPQQNQQSMMNNNNTIQMNPIQGISSQSRVVGSKTEAESVPADFMGAPIIMPMLVNGEVSAIYVKQWNVSQGESKFGEFYKAQPEVMQQTQQVSQPVQQEVQLQPQPVAFATVENVQDMQNVMNNMQDTISYLQDEIYRLRDANKRYESRDNNRYPERRRDYPPEDTYDGYEPDYDEDRRNDRRYEKRYPEQQDGRSSLVPPEEDKIAESGDVSCETQPVLGKEEENTSVSEIKADFGDVSVSSEEEHSLVEETANEPIIEPLAKEELEHPKETKVIELPKKTIPKSNRRKASSKKTQESAKDEVKIDEQSNGEHDEQHGGEDNG